MSKTEQIFTKFKKKISLKLEPLSLTLTTNKFINKHKSTANLESVQYYNSKYIIRQQMPPNVIVIQLKNTYLNLNSYLRK